MITYETLYEILRTEKNKPELQTLPKNFLKDLINYIKNKESIIKSQETKDSIFSSETEKTKKQFENTKRIIREIYERRERKIIELALLSSRSKELQETSSLLPQEQEHYQQTLKNLNKARENILINILQKRLPKLQEKPKTIKTENKENKMVRFIKPVPKFLDSDLNIHGPFDKEDIALLPSKIANILTIKQRAEEINENPKETEKIL